MVRGDLVDALPAVLAELPADELISLVDTSVHVFLPPPELARFIALLEDVGRHRNLSGALWIRGG